VTDFYVIQKSSFLISAAVKTIDDCDNLLASFMIGRFLNLTCESMIMWEYKYGCIYDNEERTDSGIQTIIVLCSQMFIRINICPFLVYFDRRIWIYCGMLFFIHMSER
jgi:hypothetical protein